MAYPFAGILPYFLSNVTIIDLYGLNDYEIARMPIAVPNDERMLAHDRRATRDYLQKRAINITIWPASDSSEEALSRSPYAIIFPDGVVMPFSIEDEDWAAMAFKGKKIFAARNELVENGLQATPTDPIELWYPKWLVR